MRFATYPNGERRASATFIGSVMRFLLPVFTGNSDAVCESENLLIRDWTKVK